MAQQRLPGIRESLPDWIIRRFEDFGIDLNGEWPWKETIDTLIETFPQHLFSAQAAHDLWCREEIVSCLQERGYRPITTIRHLPTEKPAPPSGKKWVQLALNGYVEWEAANAARAKTDRAAIERRAALWCQQHPEEHKTAKILMRQIDRIARTLIA